MPISVLGTHKRRRQERRNNKETRTAEADGHRQFTTAYAEISKKWGKGELACHSFVVDVC